MLTSTNQVLENDPDFLDRLINEHEAASFIGHSVRTLQKWRVTGQGPKYVRISARSIRYRRRELINWCEVRLQRHTGEGAA